MAVPNSFAYFLITPRPLAFLGVQPSGPNVPGQDTPAAVPIIGVQQATDSRAFFVKIGHQSAVDGRRNSYETHNPMFVFFNLQVPNMGNQFPYPTFANFGGWMKNKLMQLHHVRNPNNREMVHCPDAEEWFYSWNHRDELREVGRLLRRAQNTAEALATVGPNPDPGVLAARQQQNTVAQDNLNTPVWNKVAGYMNGGNPIWPVWVTQMKDADGNVTLAATNRNNVLITALTAAVNAMPRTRVVTVDRDGTVIFINELAALLFFDDYVKTE